MRSWIGSFCALMWRTYSAMPPSYCHVSRRSSPRASISVRLRPAVRKAISAHALGERRVVVRALVEDLEVGQERDGRARAALVGAGGGQRPQGLAARVVLLVDLAVAPAHGHVQALRERVDDADADAVQAAGHLVHVAAELAAGVQLRQHHLDARQPRLGDQVDRDAAAVVRARHRSIGMERHEPPRRNARRAPRRRRCRGPRRRGGAGRAYPWSRCTCRVDGGLPRVPRGS